MFSDGDDNQGVVLGVLFGVIALVIGLVIGLGVYQMRLAHRVAPVALLVPAGSDRIVIGPAVIGPGAAANAAAATVAAGVAVEIAAVKIYFEPGQIALPAGAAEALSSLAQEVIAGRSLSVSAWHDLMGDTAHSVELARQRALNVRDLLASLGVPPDRIELVKPQAVVGAGSADLRASRVEVRVD